ncbi:MAG: tRNA (adenine-N1)-methyltransferase [Anaerolineales bacterium]|nr:tRNA (adenine-N1)-methyltransferase [Anaerolineales bacterium]
MEDFRGCDKISAIMVKENLTAQTGDLVQLVSPTNKVFILRLIEGGELQTHRGVLSHAEVIGKPWGSKVFTHLGSEYYLLQPGLGDILKEIRRNTQILYPKDIGFILLTMGIGPGVHVLEAGTGSGALTTALAWAVGPQGRVTSYEARAEMQNLARKNLERVGLAERVEFKLRDINQGFDERGVDALFLDVANSYDFIAQAKEALKPGGYFGSILPTTNQVTKLLGALYNHQFSFVDVCEILLRYYKPVPERFRPTDRMVAHTGYLIFGRAMLPEVELPEPELMDASEYENDDERWSPDLI